MKVDSNYISLVLRAIERDHNVRVIYAVESGSRAYGFASEDSDHDIRGIYVRERNFYMSINVENKRDVIEKSLGSLDVALWDIRKALGLMRKSNPHLYEWLLAPYNLVYRDSLEIYLISDYDLLEEFYSPRRIFYHYLHMAKGNYKKYIQGKDTVRVKKYLYVIRPLLILGNAQDVTDEDLLFGYIFADNIDDLIAVGEVNKRINSEQREAVEDLVQRKRDGEELGESDPMPLLNDWIDYWLSEYEGLPDRLPDSNGDAEKLNKVFRMIVAGG